MEIWDGLSSLGKTHTIVSHVKLSVIWADEYISQNPKGTSRSRDINTEETTQAFCLSQHRHLWTNHFIVYLMYMYKYPILA